MKQLLLFSSIALLFVFAGFNAAAQVPTCDASVPYYLVDLRGFPDGSWTSPTHVRKGLCCTSSNPDRCTSYKIYIDSGTSMIKFEIASGAVPSGAMYYQIGCGPMIPVGDAICLTGVGPHYLTFCKPGNNTNTYKITAVPTPTITGTFNVCHGSTTTLTGAPTAGTWSSSDTTKVKVGSTGIVTGVSPGTATISYSVGPCRYKTVTFTVNQMPTAIGGTARACTGLTSTLTNGVAGGTWTSSNTDTATVGLTTGIVTGIAKGKTTITYTTTGGCKATKQFTVYQSPPAISGAVNVCTGLTTTLTNGVAGGTWSSSNTDTLTIGLTSGIVTGIAKGKAFVTYTTIDGCTATKQFTVNQTPAAISGVAVVCAGLTSTLGNTLSGGTWASSNTDTATVGLSTGVVTGVAKGKTTITYTTTGGCTATKQFTVHGFPNPIRTDAPTTPEIHDICLGNRITLTAIEGPEGYVGWGTQYWTSGNTAVATIDSPGFGGFVTAVGLGVATISFTRGNGCYSTYTFTVHPMPAAITGINSICNGLTTTLYNTTPGGTWSALPGSAATINSTTGVVTSAYAGIAPIAYTLYYPHQGCRVFDTVTVNPIPLHWIEGTASICAGGTTTFTNLSTGGTWTSGNPSVATIHASTGVIAGISAGTAVITYELYSGCPQTRVVTVTPLPGAISGVAPVCPGNTITLSNTITGGTWVADNISTIHLGWTTGVVTGLAPGTSNITYTLPTGCRVMTSVSVNAVTSITGNGNICLGATTSLSAGITGGTWSSSNPSVASIGTGSCVVNGLSSGTATITYTLPTGCIATKAVTVSTYATTIETSPLYTPALHNICVGNVLQLSAAGAGTWTSSNPSVATVSTYTGPGSGMAGQVTGLTAGSVIITYMATSTCYSTYTLTVNPTPDPICGSTTICQYSTCTMSCASTGGTWFSLDFTHVYVNPTCGAITGAAPGTATIYYRQFGYNGCMVSTCVTVTPAAGGKSAGSGTGMQDIETADTSLEKSQMFTTMGQANNYTAFPNPGNGNITIRQRYPTDDVVHIRMIDYSGKIMHEDVLQFKQGTGKLQVDHLPPGLYFTELHDNSGEPSTISIAIKK